MQTKMVEANEILETTPKDPDSAGREGLKKIWGLQSKLFATPTSFRRTLPSQDSMDGGPKG